VFLINLPKDRVACHRPRPLNSSVGLHRGVVLFATAMKAAILKTVVTSLMCVCLTDVVSAQSAEQEIMKAEQSRIEARIARDAVAAGKLMSEDFVQIDRLGHARTKKEMLNEFTVGITSIMHPTVQVFGDSAIVIGVGKAPRLDLQFVHVWRREHGHWLAIFVQNTPINTSAPEPLPTEVEPTSTVWPQGKTPDERQLIKTLEALNEALASMNVDAYHRLTAENFVDVGSRGNVTTRADFLRKLGTTPNQPRETSNSDFYIRVYGRIAIVSFNSTPPSRVTHIFVKRNNHWKQLLRQATPVRETLSPGFVRKLLVVRELMVCFVVGDQR
jgi:hypothetical protein